MVVSFWDKGRRNYRRTENANCTREHPTAREWRRRVPAAENTVMPVTIGPNGAQLKLFYGWLSSGSGRPVLVQTRGWHLGVGGHVSFRAWTITR